MKQIQTILYKTLRTNEFETRKNDLLVGLSRFSNAIKAMLGEESKRISFNAFSC